MKNYIPTLEDIMRMLYVLQNEGYISRFRMEYILEEKFLVSDIEYEDNKFICYQGDTKTSINV